VLVHRCDEWKIAEALTAGADALVGLAVLTETVVLWSRVSEGKMRVEGGEDEPVGL
jgi:hypothetical protein